MVWSRLHTVSFAVFLLCVSVVVLWDIGVVLLSRTPGATISYSVYHAAKQSPVIALFVGIVIGHLFWPTLDLNRPQQQLCQCCKDNQNIPSGERR